MAWIVLGVILFLIIALVVIYAKTYNKLVKLKNAVENTWAQVDVELKRRFDLIPNLVETAKGYMKHESEVLTAITQARSGIASTKGPGGSKADRMAAESAMSGALAKFQLAIEAYPELKADRQMNQLMGELASTENSIAGKRSTYNNTVNAMNTAVESFPTNIIAGMFNFEKAQYFKVEVAEEREAPKVSF
ncbi:MAG: LemA family protein [Myxococcales bacterium]|nr:LemA family protein [Myxococcales bacterium]